MREKKEDRAENEGDGWFSVGSTSQIEGEEPSLAGHEEGKPKAGHIENLQDSRAKPSMGFDIECRVL
jgi:hypothetical protein